MKTTMEFRLPDRRRRKRKARLRRVIVPAKFLAVQWNEPKRQLKRWPWREALASALIGVGIAIGFFWPQQEKKPKPKEEIFVFEEEIPPPPPEPPPPPPDPEPPPPKVELPEELPPPSQFGLEEDALSETGDLAVAAGNTLMMEADTVVAPPPSLSPVPVFIDQPPRVVKGNPPEYPPRALERSLEGTVVVLITIDTAGHVTGAHVETSAGKDFDEEVLKAARATLFQPPIRQGRRVSAKFRKPFEFRLEE